LLRIWDYPGDPEAPFTEPDIGLGNGHGEVDSFRRVQ